MFVHFHTVVPCAAVCTSVSQSVCQSQLSIGHP